MSKNLTKKEFVDFMFKVIMIIVIFSVAVNVIGPYIIQSNIERGCYFIGPNYESARAGLDNCPWEVFSIFFIASLFFILLAGISVYLVLSILMFIDEAIR